MSFDFRREQHHVPSGQATATTTTAAIGAVAYHFELTIVIVTIVVVIGAVMVEVRGRGVFENCVRRSERCQLYLYASFPNPRSVEYLLMHY